MDTVSLSTFTWELLLAIAFSHPAAFRGMALMCREFAGVLCDPEMQKRAKRHFSKHVSKSVEISYLDSINAEHYYNVLPNGMNHGKYYVDTIQSHFDGTSSYTCNEVYRYSTGLRHGDFKIVSYEQYRYDEVMNTKTGTYMYGELDGRFIDNGPHDITDETYRKGVLHGFSKITIDGKTTVSRYVHGVLHGFTHLDDNDLTCRFRWVDGQVDGVVKSWYLNGRLRSLSYYKNGIREGVWKQWGRRGNLIIVEVYVGGQLVDKGKYQYDTVGFVKMD
jgi:antitoxin component YwqK of YwqJK toxin-antitoxin module